MTIHKLHPFLPRAAQTPVFLKWLRRTHGWFGLFGATAGLLFSVTTIFLLHHNFGIDTNAENVKSELTIPEGVTIDSPDALGVLVKSELGLRSQWREGLGRGMGMGRAGEHAVTFNSPGDVVQARYKGGDASISLVRQERGFLATLNRMHLGNGIPLGWKIMADVFAGALIFLAISGFLMWGIQLHGPLQLAVGLFSTTLIIITIYFTIGA